MLQGCAFNEAKSQQTVAFHEDAQICNIKLRIGGRTDANMSSKKRDHPGHWHSTLDGRLHHSARDNHCWNWFGAEVALHYNYANDL